MSAELATSATWSLTCLTREPGLLRLARKVAGEADIAAEMDVCSVAAEETRPTRGLAASCAGCNPPASGATAGRLSDARGLTGEYPVAHADVRSELPLDLVSEAKIEVRVGESRAQCSIGNVLKGEAEFGAGLKDQALGDPEVVFCFHRRGNIGVFGDVER